MDDVVSIIKRMERECCLAKMDIASVFQILHVHQDDHELLGIQFQDQLYYDKRLPMGCSILCSIFESFSVDCLLKVWDTSDVNILDDCLLIGPPNSSMCGLSLKQFITMCNVLGIHMKSDKYSF